MFLETRDIEVIKRKIQLKSFSGGVEKGFMNTNSYLATVPGVYILTSNCLTVIKDKTKYKTNLFALCTDILKSEKNDSMPPFIMSSIYSEITEFFNTELLFGTRKHTQPRSLPISYKIDVNEVEPQSSLMNSCKNKWFGFPALKSKFLMELSWEKHKMMNLWLRDTFEDSYKEFKETFGGADVISFVEHIKMIDIDTLRISVLSCSPVKRSYIDQLKNILCWDKSKVYKLTRIAQETKKEEKRKTDQHSNYEFKLLENRLARLKSFGMKLSAWTSYLNEICSDFNDITLDKITRSLLTNLSPRYYTLALILALKNEMTSSGSYFKDKLTNKVLEKIQMCNQGSLLWYKSAQKKVSGIYTGKGVIEGVINNNRIVLHVENNKATLLETDSLILLRQYRAELFVMLKKLNITETTMTYSDYALIIPINGNPTITGNANGCPINILSKKKKKFTLTPVDIELDLYISDTGNLSIRGKVANSQIDFINFSPRFLDEEARSENIELTPVDRSLKEEALVAWMKNEPLSVKACNKFAEDNFEWYVERISYRLEGLNKLPHKIFLSANIEERDEMLPIEDLYEDNDDENDFETSGFNDFINSIENMDINKVRSWAEMAEQEQQEEEDIALGKSIMEIDIERDEVERLMVMYRDSVNINKSKAYRVMNHYYTTKFFDEHIKRIEEAAGSPMQSWLTRPISLEYNPKTGKRTLVSKILEKVGFKSPPFEIEEDNDLLY
jgi:hypothetical protein